MAIFQSEDTPLLGTGRSPYHRNPKRYLLLIPILMAAVAGVTVWIDHRTPHEGLCKHLREETRKNWEWEKEQHQKELNGRRQELDDISKQRMEIIDSLDREIALKAEENRRLSKTATELQARAKEAHEREKTSLKRLTEYERKLKEEEDERMKIGLYWASSTASQTCLGHDLIEYTARLANLRPTVDGIIACNSTPFTINGHTYPSPQACEQDDEGGIIGHWTVRGELKCQTYWEANNRDKGCTIKGSGYRRFERSLGGIHEGQDWEKLCMTTPARIMHHYYEKPHICLNWGKNGVWGIWNVKDPLCD